MQASRLDERELLAMAQLKGTEIETILRRELEESRNAGMLAKEDHIARWHQGRQQLLFEMLDVMITAREALDKRKSQRKPDKSF